MRHTQVLFIVSLLIVAGCQEKPVSDSKDEKEQSSAGQTEQGPNSPQQPGSPRIGLPDGWQQTAMVEVDPEQTEQIAARLGAKIRRLKNVIYAVDGQRFQLNTIDCPDEKNAQWTASALVAIHGGIHCRCLRSGNTVYEFVCQDLRMVERAYRDLKMTAATVNYEVTFQAAPLKQGDPMLWNRLFNACMQKNERELQALIPSFTFGNRLKVRKFGQGTGEVSYQFEPAASEKISLANGELISHVFTELPSSLGVPQVRVRVQVSSAGFSIRESRRGDEQLVAATAYWPCEDNEVVQLSERITGKTTSPAERLQQLLDWFADKQNIQYDGSVVGSRYGVSKVLQQRFGHCWDYSDLFITLSRAADIPCRQVYGWLYGQSGHVWVEVLTAEGWRAVDPTAGMGCDSRYIPLFSSEDGAVDFVYASLPKITITSGP